MECLKDRFYEGVVLDGRFETISPLNHGSFGMVFMAKDLTNGEHVAIKCLTKKSAAGESESSFAVDEHSEELACHARLGSHPNIVNLIHSFETEAHIYIVLELCSRGDLYEAIRTGTGPLETEHVRQFMFQLVDAVTHIHDKGTYHRDIKPENIFLTHSGEMKLGDFGLATTDSWSYESTVGSDRYMAPEQYDSAQAGYAPDKADIWAIGIVLLNVLFSRNPFTTPTESDPLFLDFSRDKQSLFDVFPTMSQDTYEVIAQCMTLDPRKRSLEAVRNALDRVVSFTTFDEYSDDFCGSERQIIAASANREPLRTPSIQSPQMDTGSFPWAKALHASPPQTFRQLSVIPDTESYTEDLFPASEQSTKDWFSVGQQTPSMASVLDSSLGASMKSLAIRRPIKNPPKASATPISGSLPITMSRPKPLPSLSSVFGKKNDMVSKSWSDLWDEEIEEEEEEAEKQLQARQAQNARTYSNESASGDVTLRSPLEPQSASVVNIEKGNVQTSSIKVKDIDSDLIADGFFFHDTPAPPSDQQVFPRYSPPPKRTTFDKWSALGERRRAYSGLESERPPDLWKPKRNVGLGFSGFGAGVWDTKSHTTNKFQEKATCPYSRARVQQPRKYSRGHVGDLEWVSGWSDLHL